jgi:hypothetical protein
MMRMKLLYYDDVTPPDYQPPGFEVFKQFSITFRQGWVDYKLFVVRYNYSYFKNM